MTAATSPGQALAFAIVIGLLVIVIVWGFTMAERDTDEQREQAEQRARLRRELERHEPPRWQR